MKKVVSLVMIMVMMLTNIAFAFEPLTEETWYSTAVNNLNDLGYFSAAHIEEFEPTREVTKHEFVTMTIKTIDWKYPDIDIYENALTIASDELLAGFENYTDDEFNDTINRFEAASVLYNLTKLYFKDNISLNDITHIASNVKDWNSIPEENKTSVECMFSSGIMSGTSDKRFNGEGKLTLAAASVMIYRVIHPETRIKAEYTEFGKLLSEYTTYTTKDANRNFNVARAASSINGTILKPGEQFSYYKTVGAASKANGYKESIILSGGKYVKGYGGGVCQDATTLFNAALLANLQIDERRPHGLRSSYVKPGYDATYASGSIDFKFTNTYSTPIKLVATFDEPTRALTMKIYGADIEEVPNVKLYTKGGGRTYTLYREVNGVVNYTTKSVYNK